MSIKLFKYMNGNGNRIRIPKSWILLVVFIVSVIGAGAWVYTIPPNGLTNQTGIWFGNNSLDGKNVTGDKFDVFGVFGIVIGSYVDSYSCAGSFCIYKPWYAFGLTYAKNMSTGMIDYSGTDTTTVLTSIPVSKSIHFTDGTFELSNLSMKTGWQISCNGASTTLKRASTDTRHIVLWSSVENVSISNCVVDVNETSTIDFNTGVLFYQANNSNIRDVEIRNSGKVAMGIYDSNSTEITNLKIVTNSSTLYDGINVINSSHTTLDNIVCETGDDCVAIRNVTGLNGNNIMATSPSINPVVKIRAMNPNDITQDINLNQVYGENRGWVLHTWASNGLIRDININGISGSNISKSVAIFDEDAPGLIYGVNINSITLNNTLRDKSYQGINISGGNNISISQGTIETNTDSNGGIPGYGIFVDGVNITARISDITVRNSKDGLYTIGCLNCTINAHHNDFTGNFRDGVRLGNGTHLKDNNIKNNAVRSITILPNAVNSSIENNFIEGNANNAFANSLGASSWQKDNYGIAGFDHGIVAMTATLRVLAFGANDWVTNTSRSPPFNRCVSTAAGNNWVNSTDGGQC